MNGDTGGEVIQIPAGTTVLKQECGWTKLFHPSGAYVTLPVAEEPRDYGAMLANVDAMLAAGFAVLAPGLEEGEQKDVVGYVARRAKTNRDDSTSAIIDLYPDNDGTKYKFLSVYLDTVEDVKAFEFASGLELEHMPAWPAGTAPERGKNDQYIIRAPHPFGVIFGPHPKYDAAEAAKATQSKPYTIPKKRFVRWEKERPGAASATPAPSKDLTDAQAASLWKEAQDFLKRDPSLADFNDWIKRYTPSGPRKTVDQFWAGVRRHAQAAGFVWDERAACYLQPQQGDF